MSILVKGKVLGDWLRSEAAGQRSRAVKTVLSGENIKCGDICFADADGKMSALDATGNETHLYTLTGTPTAGTFAESLWNPSGYWCRTKNIPFGESQANVIKALNQALIGADSGAVTSVVTGAGTAITAMTVVFSGTNYASKTFPLGQMDVSGLTTTTACVTTRSVAAGAARNEVQTVVFGAAATGGTVKVGVRMPQTGKPVAEWPLVMSDAAAWNATDATFLAAVQAALDDICGSNGIVVTARSAVDTDLGLVFTFSGTGFASKAHPFLVIDTSALTSVTTNTITRTTSGGYAGDREGNKAVAIAMEDVDASSADASGLFLVRDAVVDKDALGYGGGYPSSCVSALEEVGIVAHSQSGYASLPGSGW
jgi:hypothetical protein